MPYTKAYMVSFGYPWLEGEQHIQALDMIFAGQENPLVIFRSSCRKDTWNKLIYETL